MPDVVLRAGDCRDVLATLPECSVDAVVCDPPYELGFMGRSWDRQGVAFCPDTWAAVLRVMKPGAHLVAFGAPKNYHRLACAIEDAGFEIRDSLMWVFGSGFPKSQDVSKAIDKMGGQPWADFAGLLDGLIKRAGFNYTSLDAALGIPSAGSNSCYWVRTDERGGLPPRHYYERLKELLSPPVEFTDLYDKAEREVLAIERRKNAPSGIVGVGRASVDVDRKITAPATDAAKQWSGWGSALKPAYEPIVLARKPLSEGTIAANVLRWGTGALNIDATRIETSDKLQASASEGVPFGCDYEAGTGRKYRVQGVGRWPANLCHDGSDEVLAGFPETKSGSGKRRPNATEQVNTYQSGWPANEYERDGDSGSAARFFYNSKANKQDRAGSKHPTVKPVALMRWLVRMVTPPGGTVLDPFAGSGTTGQAAMEEGFNAILIEREAEYQADIERRLNMVAAE